MVLSTPSTESTSITSSSSGRLIRKMDMATRYQIRVSTFGLTVAVAALTAKGMLLAAWVIAGCPTADEYDYEERGGKIFAVHRRTSPIHQKIQAAFDSRP